MWEHTVKTVRGLALDRKLLASGAKLHITGAAAGSGRVEVAWLSSQAGVKNRVWELEVGLVGKLEGEATLPIRARNIGLKEMFALQQIGIYAQDPEDGEILYILSQVSDENGLEIPSGAEAPGFMMQWNFTLAVPNAGKAKIRVNSEMLLTADQGDARYVLQGSDTAPVKMVQLWPASGKGSWSSGTITAPGIRDYELLAVQISSGNVKIVCAWNDGKTIVTGATGHLSSNQVVRTIIFNVSANNVCSLYSGTTAPAMEVSHVPSGSHGASTAIPVTAIYGIATQGVPGPKGDPGVVPDFISTPYAAVGLLAAYTLTNTNTALNMGNLETNSPAMFTLSGGGIKCNFAGKILVRPKIYATGMTASSTNLLRSYPAQNGSVVVIFCNTSGTNGFSTGFALFTVASGDIITLQASVGGGGGNIAAGFNSAGLIVTRLN